MYKEIKDETNFNYKVVMNDGTYCKFYKWYLAYELFSSDRGSKLYLMDCSRLKTFYTLAMWK